MRRQAGGEHSMMGLGGCHPHGTGNRILEKGGARHAQVAGVEWVANGFGGVVNFNFLSGSRRRMALAAMSERVGQVLGREGGLPL
jgi:hypothetical protein